jgi:hypothetical protein
VAFQRLIQTGPKANLLAVRRGGECPGDDWVNVSHKLLRRKDKTLVKGNTMLIKKLLVVASLVGSSMLIWAGPASACQGICTPEVVTSCVWVGEHGVEAGPGGVKYHHGGIEVQPISECV